MILSQKIKKMQNSNFIKSLQEWEGIAFPLQVSSLKLQKGHYKIPFDSKIEIWRDTDYKLKGTLKGVTNNHNDLEYRENETFKKVGFIEKEDIIAKNDDFDFLITDFLIESISLNSYKTDNGIWHNFTCDISIQSVETISTGKTDIYTEWYLCSMPRVLFPNRTIRYENQISYKIREGIDKPLENHNDIINGYSMSWDFAILKYNDFKIIIQEINQKYLPEWSNGLSIEYRSNNSIFPNDRIKKIVQEFISFILGSHMQKIGSSEYSKDFQVIKIKSNNTWKKNLRINGNINPIPLEINSDRFHFEKLINNLFLNFIEQYEKNNISDCLWKLWIGNDLSIGTNLPIIASGLEVLADSYLKSNNLIVKKSRTEKKEYQNLIKHELESLELKLLDYPFGKSVLNKLKNPYNLGVGEKMKLFFNEINISFKKDSLENQALLARNLMTHQKLNTDDYLELLRAKKLSDAYISLVNRVILIIIGYNGYYIDYSKEGIRYLKINQNL